MDNIYVKKKNESVLHVGTDMGISNELSDFFSFFVPGYKFMPAYKNRVWDGKVRLFNAQSCELPVGLFPYLQEFAGPRQYTVEVDHDAFYGIPGSTNDVDIDEFVKYVEETGYTGTGHTL